MERRAYMHSTTMRGQPRTQNTTSTLYENTTTRAQAQDNMPAMTSWRGAASSTAITPEAGTATSRQRPSAAGALPPLAWSRCRTRWCPCGCGRSRPCPTQGRRSWPRASTPSRARRRPTQGGEPRGLQVVQPRSWCGSRCPACSCRSRRRRRTRPRWARAAPSPAASRRRRRGGSRRRRGPRGSSGSPAAARRRARRRPCRARRRRGTAAATRRPLAPRHRGRTAHPSGSGRTRRGRRPLRGRPGRAGTPRRRRGGRRRSRRPRRCSPAGTAGR
mmetsp:Transcript_4463/g.12620  ORF Transcript_4463/g.12620 Transcript_4463/m.12620 type:complete len:274 (+) Transcript_4463:91-912(+)